MKNKRIETAEGSANNHLHFPPMRLTRREFLEICGLGLAATACGKAVRTLETLTPSAAQNNTGTYQPTTSAPTESPTETLTTTPTEDPYRSVTLTPAQFASMSDDEVRRVAPTPNIAELVFPPETQLVPDVVGRWGEGSNYVIYKNTRGRVKDGQVIGNDYELAWNVETGSMEHCIFAPAYEAEIAGEHCMGIPFLVLSDPTILAEDGGGGYFQLNKEVDRDTGEELIPDSQARVGKAFNSALALYWWGKRGPGALDDRYLFDHGHPDFTEIPGYETLGGELKRIRDRQYWYDKASGPLRDRIVAFMRDRFLLTLKQKRQLGEPMEVTLQAKYATPVDLTRQNVMITRFVCTGEYQPRDLNEIYPAQQYAHEGGALAFIEQTNTTPCNLAVDGIKQGTFNYGYGGEVVWFMRYFYGGRFGSPAQYSVDYVPNPSSSNPEELVTHSRGYQTGYATILCPPDLQPGVIRQYYEALGLPGCTIDYSGRQPFPGQQSAVNFVKRAQ